MTWELFYLVCFLVGFLLSLVSFLGGAVHLHIPARMHLHVGHGGAQGVARGGGRASVSPFNFATLTAFLAWFGGAGYLLTRFSGLWFWLALAVAVVAGVAGGAVVFWFLAKVLLAHEKDLDPADYEMTGVLGRVSSSIREGGTGEIIFSQDGVRHCAGARSENGSALTKGTEVIVTRYEKGIAYVRPWDELVEGAKAGAGGN